MDAKGLSEAQWAWLAGLLEGEGCFAPESKSGRLRIQMGMTDEDVIRRVHEMTGVGNVYTYDTTKYKGHERDKRQYRWVVQKQADVRWILDNVLPWLGERRTARIRGCARYGCS